MKMKLRILTVGNKKKAGMLATPITNKSSTPGWVAGLIVLIKVCLDTQISFLWYRLIGFLVTTSAGWVSSLLFPAPPSQNLDSLTWESRYQEPKANANSLKGPVD